MASEDFDALLRLPDQIQSARFAGLPPDRAGRALQILGATASRQLDEREFLEWDRGDITRMLHDDFGWIVARDKVRHDVEDRLVQQRLMGRERGRIFLTVRGMARYFCCLAKFTTLDVVESVEDVLNYAALHRERILFARRLP